MDGFDKSLFDKVSWNATGAEIERESFRRIEEEAGELRTRFDDNEWRVARRLIHTTADSAVAKLLRFRMNPAEAAVSALRRGAPIYADSNMIKSGISVPKLKKINPSYEREAIMCHVADPDVAETAKRNGSTRALAAVGKAARELDGAVVLIGNAPLALARVVQLAVEEGLAPAVIVGMPVGFVNVLESKALLAELENVPAVWLEGRRGGSALAVATLHAMMEIELEKA
jgi:precorrin isomerase